MVHNVPYQLWTDIISTLLSVVAMPKFLHQEMIDEKTENFKVGDMSKKSGRVIKIMISF